MKLDNQHLLRDIFWYATMFISLSCFGWTCPNNIAENKIHMWLYTSLSGWFPLSRFLYSDEVHIGPETVMTTLYTAKKYAVPALEGHCVEFLTKHLRADNAFMLLTQVRI